jgi:hypothetical protein
MKKILQVALVLLMAATVLPAQAATNDPIKEKVATMTEEQKDARIAEMKRRVHEIKDINKSTLSKQERKELRKELRSMNKEAKQMGRGGVYISLAGILIIILVLIIIL